MSITRRLGLVGASGLLVAGRAHGQHRILSAEDTVLLEHQDREARLREAVRRLGMDSPPRFTVKVVRIPGFRADIPVLRVAFSERTFFDTAEWRVLSTGLEAVRAVATATRGEAPDVALFVAGHTDNRGGEAYNQNLSVNRANAVSDALMTYGVGEVALWRVGFGESAPLYANDSDDHRAFNRRVEFLFGARVEPVVQVLSDQLEDACISASQAESRRCIVELPRRRSFIATQSSSRDIGVPLAREETAPTPTRPGRAAAAPSASRVGLQAPRHLTIALHQTTSIAAPVR